jgi:gastrin-releasing peptide receptor
MIKSNTSRAETEEFKILKSYIDPTVYLLILFFGLLGNGFLLFMFLRHRDVRTTANIMIMNLVVCDFLNLGINAPLHYLFRYNSPQDELTCILYTSARQFLRSASALSVVALCIQRFNIVLVASRRPKRFSSTIYTAFYIGIIWTVSLGLASPSAVIPVFSRWLCSTETDESVARMVILVNFLFYCVLLPSVMTVFSVLTARRLNQSAERVPGETHHRMHELRCRSAHVVISLAIVFVFTYFPFQMWCLIVYWWRMDREDTVVLYAEFLSKYLLFANGCFNPIALFISSSNFRTLFVRHLCRDEHNT